ncbi:hypothetical protein [Polaribacter aquimarinus]|uniref:Outer membrane protein beta-barrel domain-containing protein n=1 Tax=Polaribacter aquimarinus TaxID=2100726 RepID=A0A2U2J7M8_9FLAO|nr:hypothetical protein [Polaribacter aquimarinus]PWG04327.1 hypothetical protein DIS07_13035 [Polaribacter aquimarinus]
MKKKKYLFIICCCCVLYATAQKREKFSNKERKNAFGISGGTGFGFDYSRKLSDKFYTTISYNSFVYSIKDFEQEISGETLLVNTDLDFTNIDVKISYHPFSSAFKLVAGLGFFSSSNVNISTTFKDNIKIGDVEFNSADSGSLLIDMNWGKTSPYIGLGFGRSVPRKRLGFAIDIGTYMSSSPEITLDATGIIEDTKNQEGLLNETFESFKFIPYAAFRLSYSF